MRARRRVLAVVVGLGCIFPAAQAGGTRFFDMSDFHGVENLVLDGTTVSRNGGVVLAPASRALLGPSVAVLWDAAPGPDGSVYAVGGPPGVMLEFPEEGEGRTVLEAGEAEMTAIAALDDGQVVVGLSPGGRVVQVTPDGRQREILQTGSRYVWDLLVQDSGVLWVAAGDPGALFRVNLRTGSDQRVLDLGEEQARCLALDSDGSLLVGSAGRGIIRRIPPSGPVAVLLDSDFSEVSSLAVSADGVRYAGLVQASPAEISAEKVRLSQPVDPRPPGKTGAAGSRARSAGAGATSVLGATQRSIRSSVIRIERDETVATIWESEKEIALSLLARPGNRIWIGTSPEGGIDLVDSANPPMRLARLPARSVTALHLLPGGTVLATTGGLGSVALLSPDRGAEGMVTSPVHDAGQGARFGRARIWSRTGNQDGLAFSLRSGNTSRPDSTWSDWSRWHLGDRAAAPAAPPGRFVQWRVRLRTGASSHGRPELARVQVAYLPPNQPPRLDKVQVLAPGVALETLPSPAGSAAGPASGSQAQSSGGTANVSAPSRRVRRAWRPGRRTVSWEASDEDGDDLVARLWIRADGEAEFLPVATHVLDSFYVLGENELPDGGFVIRVEVSDAPGNTPERAAKAVAETPRFIVDRTPPRILDLRWRREKGGVVLEFSVADAVTPPSGAQVSIDGGPFEGVFPGDGIADGLEETYRVRRELPDAGPHRAVIRATDGTGNTTTARLRFDLQEKSRR
ncbi:MAG: hypothetical protein ACE5HD_10095 [Acidobacteriota bacterium]